MLRLATWFTVPFFAVLLPLLVAAVTQRFGQYLYHLWAFKAGFDLKQQAWICLSYLSSLFWGMDPEVRTYQPAWGGFLNPVLASLFFLGAVGVLSGLKNPFHRWLLAGFGICLLPGFLTQDLETFRMLPIMPILAAVSLLGLTRLLPPPPSRRGALCALALLLASGALDFRHLMAYHHIWDSPLVWSSYTKSIGRYRAYRILEEKTRSEGPGLIFQDFVQGLADQSLTVATYGWNAVLNPRLSPEGAKWAAVMVNANFQPFLKQRFPEGKAHPLHKDLLPPDGGWMLFIMDVTPSRLETFARWQKASLALKPFLDKNLSYVTGRPFDEILRALRVAAPASQEDPFLRACYWEKVADIQTKENFRGEARGSPPPNPAVGSLETAIRQGYPAAHLYRQLGILWLMQDNAPQARRAFEQAARASVNLTDAQNHLEKLKASHP
jgi:hypothetical protein